MTTERERIVARRCAWLDQTYNQQMVSNLRAHLRIHHRTRLPVDAPMAELRRAWLVHHPAIDQEETP